MRLALPLSLSGAGAAAVSAYSRRVARLKLILPGIGLGLLLLIAVWPRFAPLLERMRFTPAIDLHEARELRMLNPRYVGTDRQDRPFVVTAAIGRQSPDHQDLMSLDGPRGEVRLHSGAGVMLAADSGVYQTQTQLLDLFGNVALTHTDGSRYVTQSGRFDIAHNSASGHDPIAGSGPQGAVKGEGFQILDKGDTIVFEGRSQLVLTGARPTGSADPAAVPRTVAAVAARAESEHRAAAVTKPPGAGKQRPTAATAKPRVRPTAKKPG